MNMNITSKKEQPLLSSTLVEGELIFEKSTPSRLEVGAEIAKQMKTKPELVIIRKIETVYGFSKANVSAVVYVSEKERDIIEHEWSKKRGAKKTEEKPDDKKEAPAEAKKEEAPRDDKKEVPSEKKEEAPVDKKEEKPAEEKKAAPETKKDEAPQGE